MRKRWSTRESSVLILRKWYPNIPKSNFQPTTKNKIIIKVFICKISSNDDSTQLNWVDKEVDLMDLLSLSVLWRTAKSMTKRKCWSNKILSCLRSRGTWIGCKRLIITKNLHIQSITTKSLHQKLRGRKSKTCTKTKWLREDFIPLPKLRRDKERWRGILQRFTRKLLRDRCWTPIRRNRMSIVRNLSKDNKLINKQLF